MVWAENSTPISYRSARDENVLLLVSPPLSGHEQNLERNSFTATYSPESYIFVTDYAMLHALVTTRNLVSRQTWKDVRARVCLSSYLSAVQCRKTHTSCVGTMPNKVFSTYNA